MTKCVDQEDPEEGPYCINCANYGHDESTCWAAPHPRTLKPPKGYTAEELDRDNPYNQWMNE